VDEGRVQIQREKGNSGCQRDGSREERAKQSEVTVLVENIPGGSEKAEGKGGVRLLDVNKRSEVKFTHGHGSGGGIIYEEGLRIGGGGGINSTGRGG